MQLVFFSKPGRPKTTWPRTVMVELSGKVKLTWGEAQHAEQNRAKWKEIVVALCPTGDEEEQEVLFSKHDYNNNSENVAKMLCLYRSVLFFFNWNK